MKSPLALVCLVWFSVVTCQQVALGQPSAKIASNLTSGQASSAALIDALPQQPQPKLGELGIELGSPLTIVAVTLEGPFKGFDGGPNIRIKKIAGVATQQMIQMPIRAAKAASDAGWEQFETPGGPSLLEGKTYELQGYETGKYVDAMGNPIDSGATELATGTTGVFLNSARTTDDVSTVSAEGVFRNEFVIVEAKQVEPLTWSPADFVDREALISGVARNVGKVAIIQGNGWKLALGPQPWEDWQIGKSAEAFCKIKTSNVPQTYVASDCARRLVDLQDQAGRAVTLRGTARTMNNLWWFNYRGTDMYFDNLDPRSAEYSTLEDWHTIEVSGTLHQAVLPPAARYVRGYKDERETIYLLRNPSWKPVTLTEMETPHNN